MPKDLKPDKEMNRGDVDFRHTNGLYAVKWFDNRHGHLHSTFDGSQLTTVKRRKRGEAEKVSIPWPQMIVSYNQGIKVQTSWTKN